MGIKQSSLRFMGWKKDEETRIPDHSYSFLHDGQQHDHPDNSQNGHNINFSQRLLKLFSIHKWLYNALKRILHNNFSFSVLQKPKNPKPVLPVVHPTANLSSNSSSGQPIPIAPHRYFDFDPDPEPICREENYSNSTTAHVIVSIPDSDYGSSSISRPNANGELVDWNVILEEFLRGQGEEYEVEEEEKQVIRNVGVVNETKWIKHYSSHQRILLVGEGDFSFSACLAVAFVQASNITATSLDSKEFLKANYQCAPSNIEKLRNRGGKVIHGIDATEIANNAWFALVTYNRIIYNFPFAGFFKNKSRKYQLERHRRLVSLFLKNAKKMISEDGEIHITHKTNEFHNEWKLESIASSHGLRLIEAVPFHHRDYPDYYTKCGFGGDNNFNSNPSKTYKFGMYERLYKYEYKWCVLCWCFLEQQKLLCKMLVSLCIKTSCVYLCIHRLF